MRAEEGQVHEAVMDGAVVADEAGAVHAEDDGEILERDFLPDLVEGALDEGGVDAGDGAQAAFAHAGGHGGEVAFADADVDVAVGE